MTNKSIFVAFDLDDTLYKEMDYLKSAYKEIASYVEGKTGRTGVYQEMVKAYRDHVDVFGMLESMSDSLIKKDDLLQKYRNHIPKIVLNEDAKACLNDLKARGIVLGIITDGRSVAQRNKMEALGLEKWIPKENWIVSEEIDSEKPNQKNYALFEEKYPNHIYYYIGNNPKKDFKGANELGWQTICLLDSGDEIHPQTFDQESIFLPKYKVATLKESIAFFNLNTLNQRYCTTEIDSEKRLANSVTKL